VTSSHILIAPCSLGLHQCTTGCCYNADPEQAVIVCACLSC